MTTIINKYNCCGCSACAQRCPNLCITMQEDCEGFLYPNVDESACLNCGICGKVCPVLNQESERNPIACFAAKNIDETVRSASSSGGIFFPIAESIIHDGGLVFGARYNKDWEVVHACAETIDNLKLFQGSKYVQSRIGTCYKEAEQHLKEGRKILFSGTPCQVSGLYKFLRKEYDNLYTIDVVCHGTPSPKVWRDYVSILPTSGVKQIRMKDKITGWRGYSFSLLDENEKRIFTERARANKYLIAFSRNLTIRPSCFNCPAKAGKSRSDITLADYWGIEKLNPEMDDNKGTSFVCCNTEKGRLLLTSLGLKIADANYESTVPYNHCIYKSTLEPDTRTSFWETYNQQGINALLALKPTKQNIIKRIIKHLIR